MNKLKILLPILLILALLLAVPAMAEEAEDLTAGLTVKVVDKPGKIKAITDGSYKSFWESSNRKEPWVVLSSDKPIYGLYLCFQKMPDSYVIQKQNGDSWVTVAEGGSPRHYHAYFELGGLKKVRILSTADKKNIMGFNEIFAFGEGELPEWVQRWEEPSGKTDILFLATHPDDENAPEITRRYIRFGGSPRAAQAMIELARVRALNQGRYNVAYEDIRFVAPACLRHRLALNFDALADGVSVEQVIKTLMEEVEKRHAQ